MLLDKPDSWFSLVFLRCSSQYQLEYPVNLLTHLLLSHVLFYAHRKVVGHSQDKSIIEQAEGFPKSIGKSLDEFKFREAIKSLVNLARIGNKYLADSEPWKLQKSNPEKVKEILYVGYIIICYLNIFLIGY